MSISQIGLIRFNILVIKRKKFRTVQNCYCKQTLTRHMWIHYMDCWILK